jgi:hypothetical protein
VFNAQQLGFLFVSFNFCMESIDFYTWFQVLGQQKIGLRIRMGSVAEKLIRTTGGLASQQCRFD